MLGFLLVDDRDGRVLGEFMDPLEALRALDLLELEEPGWPARAASSDSTAVKAP